MREIKTVLKPLEHATSFDMLVNSLLVDGWELKQRKIINTQGELSEAFNAAAVCFLYAELERHSPPFPEEITL